MNNKTDVNQFLAELNAGILKEKLAYTLSEAALATVVHGNGKKKAKVAIEFTLGQVGENEQVIVSAKIAHKMPTKRGVKSEEDTTETPMFVGIGGRLSIGVPQEDNNGQSDIENPPATVTKFTTKGKE